jgi:hypothetical protein
MSMRSTIWTRLLTAGAVSAMVALPLIPATTASAAAPLHVSFPVDVTYEIPELTEGCGVSVWFHLEGTFKGTIFMNRQGGATGEFDSQPNTWITLYSPDTGQSIRNPFATMFHNTYPEGIEPGDRVISTATGFTEKIPGLPAKAGRIYFPDGEVIEVVDGVPYTTYGPPASVTGSSYDPAKADAKICEELASP